MQELLEHGGLRVRLICIFLPKPSPSFLWRRCWQPWPSSSAAPFRDGGKLNTGGLCSDSEATPTSGPCCFPFSSPGLSVHTALSYTSAPCSLVPGQAGAVFPEKSTPPAQAQAPGGLRSVRGKQVLRRRRGPRFLSFVLHSKTGETPHKPLVS